MLVIGGNINFREYMFPVLLILAVYACLFTYVLLPKYNVCYLKETLHLLIILLLSAAVGGKLTFAVAAIPSSEHSFWYNLLIGGCVFYGGLIGAILGLLLYCRITDRSFWDRADVFISLLPLGQAIGRIGCYFNGCCYGRRYEGALSVNCEIEGVVVSVFPTWFVESVFCFCLFLFFAFICKVRQKGWYTGVYLVSYALFRFCIEFMRGDSIRGIWGVLSTSQIISIGMFVCGIGILLYSNKHKRINYMIRKEERKHANI